MKILGDRVLIQEMKPPKEEATSKPKILVSFDEPDFKMGEIILVGDECKKKVVEGDIVLFSKHCIPNFDYKNDKLTLCESISLVAIINNKKENG